MSLRHCIYSVKEYLNAAFFCLRLHQSSAHCHTHTRRSVQNLKQGKLFQTETKNRKIVYQNIKPVHSPKCESLKWQCLDFLQTLPTSAKSDELTKMRRHFGVSYSVYLGFEFSGYGAPHQAEERGNRQPLLALVHDNSCSCVLGRWGELVAMVDSTDNCFNFSLHIDLCQ